MLVNVNYLVPLSEIPYVLFRDNVQRHNHTYRLLTTEECSHMWESYKNSRNWEYDKRLVHVDKRHTYPTFVCPIAQPRNGLTSHVLKMAWSEREETSKRELNARYPFLQELLLHYAIDEEPHGASHQYRPPGIIACGGSIHRVLTEGLSSNIDVDLFFVSQSFDDAVLTTLLFDAIEFLKSKWLSGYDQSLEYISGGCDPDGNKAPQLRYSQELTPEDIALRCVFITRNENVITVYLCDQPYILRHKYQFVLRVFPTIASVLGGFDIPAGALCYDGKRITGTELGMWCNSTLVIPVDTSRRSPSYEYRLRKYNRYCAIAFTSLDTSTVELQSIDHVQDKVRSILNSYGAIISQNKIISKNSLECVANARRVLQTRQYHRIHEYAKTIGASIRDLTLNMPQRTSVLAESHVSSKTILREIHALGDQYNVTVCLYGKDIRTTRRDHKIALPYMTLTRTAESIKIGYQAYVSDYEDSSLQFDGSTNAALLRHGRTDLVITYINIGADGSKGPNCENSRAYFHWDVATPEEKTVIIKEMPRSLNIPTDILSAKPLVNLDRFESAVVCFLSLEGQCSKSRTCNLFAEYGDELHEMWHQCRNYAVDERKKQIQKYEEAKKQTGNEQDENIIAAFIADMYAMYITEFIPEHIYRYFKEHVRAVVTVLTDRILNCAEKCARDYDKIKWITENPGRQWTGSRNPIIRNPAEWYGSGYSPTVIGNGPVEITLRCMRRRHPFNLLPRDVFEMILLRILMNDSSQYLKFMHLLDTFRATTVPKMQ